jgi:hypothetical protein
VDTDPNAFEAAAGTFSDWGMASTGIAALTAEFGAADPDFHGQDLIKANKGGEFDDIIPLIGQDDELAESLAFAENEAHFRSMIDAQREVMAESSAMAENPLLAVAGALVGLGVSPSTWVGAGVAAKVGGLGWKGWQASRAANATRVALYEGTSQAALQRLENEGRPASGAGSVLLAGGAGAIAGGLVGAIMNPAAVAARASKAKAFDRAAAGTKLTDEGEPEFISVGAAKTPEDSKIMGIDPDLIDPDKAASLLQRSPYRVLRGFQALASVKSRHIGYLRHYKGNAAVEDAIKWMFRYYDNVLPTQGNLRGRASDVSAEEYARMGQDELAKALSGVQQAHARIRDAFPAFVKSHKRTITRINRDTGERLEELSKGLTVQQFERMVASAIKKVEAGMDKKAAIGRVIEMNIGPKLEEPLGKALHDELTKSFDSINAYTTKRRADAIEHGLDEDGLLQKSIDEGREAYLTQSHMVYDAMANKERHLDFLEYNMFDNPPQEWIDEMVEAILADPDLSDLAEGLVKGVDWQTLPKEVQEFVKNTFAVTHLDDAVDKAVELEAAARKRLKAAKHQTTEAALATFQRRVDAADAAAVKSRKHLDAIREKHGSKSDRYRQQLKVLRKKDEAAIEAHKELKEIKRLLRRKNGMDEITKRVNAGGAPAEKAALKIAKQAQEKAAKAVDKKEARLAKLILRKPRDLATDLHRSITRSHAEGVDAHGFDMVMNAETGKAGSVHPRVINMRRSILADDPEADEFVNQELAQVLRGYEKQVGGRLALARAFGTVRPEEQFSKLMDAPGMPAEVIEQLAADHRMLSEIALGRESLTGTGQTRAMRWTSQQFRKLNSVNFLGSVLAALLGDTGLVRLATESRSIKQAIKIMYRAFAPKLIGGRGGIKQMQDQFARFDKSAMSVMLLGGRNVIDPANVQRSRRLLDDHVMDNAISTPGTLMYDATAAIDKTLTFTSEWAMKLNFMNSWNTRIDGALREFVTQEIWKKAGTDLMEPGMQARLANAGLSPADIKRMVKAADDNQFDLEGTMVPDVDSMSVEDQSLWFRAVNAYSANAIIAPGWADTPRYFHDSLGAMIGQFQSFPYTAQNRVVRRMMMKGIKDPSVYQSAMIMIAMTAMGTAGKKAATGDLETWMDNWESPQGATTNLYELFIRSPFAIAGSATVLETILLAGGDAGNRLIEAAGGPKLLPEQSKFKAQNVIESLLGPSAVTARRGFGLVKNTFDMIADPSAETAGEVGKSALDLSIGSFHGVRMIETLLEDDL